jgi:hypothetical protein
VGRNTVVAVAGDYDEKTLVPALSRWLARLPRGAAPKRPARHTPAPADAHVQVRECQQALVFDAFPGPGALDPDDTVATVLLEILSGMAASDFKDAVVGGDILTLSKIRGLGKKTAERIVLELGDKVGVKDAWKAQSVQSTLTPEAAAKNDALLALISLGYKQVEAQKAIEKIPGDLLRPDEMLRAALRLLQG